MRRVSHYFVADRPIDAVFDIVTTARFWTEWHPATRGVEGDIDHPARLGDRIIEHVTIAGIDGSGTWTVVEHDRPRHLVLETDLAIGQLRISYLLATMAAGRTRFQRDLEYPELDRRSAPPWRPSPLRGSPSWLAWWSGRSRPQARRRGHASEAWPARRQGTAFFCISRRARGGARYEG